MKVLGIVSSPRKLGNSEMLTAEIMNLLPPSWEKKMLRLTDLKISGCTACYSCLPEGCECCKHDDMNFFLQEIKAADKIIIAAPVYFLGPQTHIKLLTDRLLCVLNDAKDYIKGKECIIVIPYGVNNWDGYAREATMNFARFLGLKILGVRTIQGAIPGAVFNEQTKEELQELAQSLTSGLLAGVQDNNLVYCPSCQSSLLQIDKQNVWRCVVCGAYGPWSIQNNQFAIVNENPHERYTLEGLREHGMLLTDIKDEFIQNRPAVKAVQKKYFQAHEWTKPTKKKQEE